MPSLCLKQHKAPSHWSATLASAAISSCWLMELAWRLMRIDFSLMKVCVWISQKGLVNVHVYCRKTGSGRKTHIYLLRFCVCVFVSRRRCRIFTLPQITSVWDVNSIWIPACERDQVVFRTISTLLINICTYLETWPRKPRAKTQKRPRRESSVRKLDCTDRCQNETHRPQISVSFWHHCSEHPQRMISLKGIWGSLLRWYDSCISASFSPLT